MPNNRPVIIVHMQGGLIEKVVSNNKEVDGALIQVYSEDDNDLQECFIDFNPEEVESIIVKHEEQL